jgi:hypothetical protein
MLTVAETVTEFPVCYGTPRFIIVLARARHWTRRIQCTPSHRIYLTSTLLLSTHARYISQMIISLHVFQLRLCMYSLPYVLHAPSISSSKNGRGTITDWLAVCLTGILHSSSVRTVYCIILVLQRRRRLSFLPSSDLINRSWYS